MQKNRRVKSEIPVITPNCHAERFCEASRFPAMKFFVAKTAPQNDNATCG